MEGTIRRLNDRKKKTFTSREVLTLMFLSAIGGYIIGLVIQAGRI